MRRFFQHALIAAALAACAQTDAERYNSGWSLGVHVRPEAAPQIIDRASAFVDSLDREGFRVVHRGEGTHSAAEGVSESRTWILEGRHPQIGPVRITVDATDDTAAERQIHVGFRFDGDRAAATRDAFQSRILGLARMP